MLPKLPPADSRSKRKPGIGDPNALFESGTLPERVETRPGKAEPRLKGTFAVRPCKNETSGCVDGQQMGNSNRTDPTPEPETTGPWSVGQLSVGLHPAGVRDLIFALGLPLVLL